MEAFVYISKSIAILSIFYLVYFLFFRKDTLFKAKRHFFLAGIIAAIVLPFVEFTKTIYIEQPILSETAFSMANFVPAKQSIQGIPVAIPFDWWMLVYGIYMAGIIVLLLRFSIQLISLWKILKSNPAHKHGIYLFVETSKNISPFSFFNYIVFNPKQHSQEELEMILHHEKIHASQWHSIDLIAANLIRAIQWINPFSWFYKKSLEENLEFIADQETAAQVPSKKQYQLTLVKTSSPLIATALTSQFYQSFIKKRIIMLNKSTSQKRNLWKLSLVLPLLCFFLWSFNVKEEITYLSSENTINKSIADFSILPTTTDAALDLMEAYFEEEYATAMVKIKNRKRDENGSIIAFDFQTKFKGQDTFQTRFSQGKAPDATNDAYNGHTIQYHEGALLVSEIGPKATSFKITEDTVAFKNLDFVLANKALVKEKAIIITAEISEAQLNAIEFQIENQSDAFEIDFKDRKRNAAGHLVKLSIDTKYAGQARFYKNVTYTGVKNNKTIGTLQLQVLDNQLHFGDTEGTMLHKISPEGVVGLIFPKKEDSVSETQTMGENPLYIINGTEYHKVDLPANTNYEVSDGIEILHPKEALKKYGEKGKDGVFIFKGITTFNEDVIEEETNAPKEINALITKESSAAVFKKIKQELMDQHGVELRYIDQRNAKGEINNLEFYFFENDKEIGTLGLGLYDPAPIETSTFFYTPNRRFNFWNATKEATLKETQKETQHYSSEYLEHMSDKVPSSFNFRITKDTSDEDLEDFKNKLKENFDIKFEYSVKRNNNQIISININYTDSNGDRGNYNVHDTDPIHEFNFYKNKHGIGFALAEDPNYSKIHTEEKEIQEIKDIHKLKNKQLKKEEKNLNKTQNSLYRIDSIQYNNKIMHTQHSVQNNTQNTAKTYYHLSTENKHITELL
ncbi:MAG: hypothetical protein ACI849_001835, partial [Patiriisocius sp.]